MGRTMKRVPMDFDWPWHKVWKGYLNPYRAIECPYCYYESDKSSNGWTIEARKYDDTFYGFKMGGRYLDHPYKPGRRYCPDAKPYKWEQWEIDFIASKPDLKKQMFGDNDVPSLEDMEEFFLQHDLVMGIPSGVQYELTEEYCRRNGFESTCPHCGGSGHVFLNDEFKRLYDEFEFVDPPTGDGYQLWETTSEGSPVSPVFASFDELCEWCAENATTFANYKATKEEWAKMLDNDFVYHKEGNVIMM